MGARGFTIRFGDGRTFVGTRALSDGPEGRGTGWRQANIDAIVGMDEYDELISEDSLTGFRWSVTWCCGASQKGTEYGAACRACYSENEHGHTAPHGAISPKLGVDG